MPVFNKFFASILFLIIALLPGLGRAQAADWPKMGVVNLQRALNNVEEGKKAMSGIEAEVNAKKKELDTIKNDLQKMRDELEKQKNVLSKDALQTKVNDLQTKFLDMQKKAYDYEQQLKEKESSAVQKIVQSLKGVVAEVAKKKGLDIVYENSTEIVLYAPQATDITAEVISAYNSGHK